MSIFYRVYKVTLMACLLCAVIGLSAATTRAQQIFDATRLHEIRIEIAQAHWQDSLAKWYALSQNGADKQYVAAGMTIDGKRLSNNSGIRYKGNYSYSGFPGLKKPFRINFDKYAKKQKLEGIGKINLHNFAGDPSFMREYIAYNMLRYCGIATPHTSFTKLYINNVYWGCYLIVEEPEDEQFLKQNFGSDEGNLFDNFDHTRLEWKGADPELYDLKLQTDAKPTAWNNLFQWIELFNTDSSYDFARKISGIFDMDEYMRILAIDVYLNNWDSYAYDGRNFFIYDDPTSAKLRWIPWDYNLAMWNRTMTVMPRDQDAKYTYKPLIQRINDNDFLRENYYRSFCKLLNNEVPTYPLQARIDSAYNLIKDAVETDTIKFFSNEAFNKNSNETVTVNMLRSGKPTDVILPGITELLASRKTVLRNELKTLGCDCNTITDDTTTHNWHVKIFPNPVVNNLTIYTEDATTGTQTIDATIYTQQGKKLQETTTISTSGTASLDLSQLPTGIYLLRLTFMGNTRIMKIVKE